MSYLLDRQNKRKRMLGLSALVLLVALAFYFRVPVFNFLSGATHAVFRPVLYLKNSTGGILSRWGAVFSSKASLSNENEDLKLRIAEHDAEMLNYNSILDENSKLKEMFGRSNEKANMLISAILSKPNRSPYDTLILDVGGNHGVKTGDQVFALGNVPIGKINSVYPDSSKVVLFSTSGERTEVLVGGKDIFIEILGRGGGNFEMILPRDFLVSEGDTVSLPGIFPYIVATVEAVVSDPRDSFTKALLTSPVNVQELKFVQVKK